MKNRQKSLSTLAALGLVAPVALHGGPARAQVIADFSDGTLDGLAPAGAGGNPGASVDAEAYSSLGQPPLTPVGPSGYFGFLSNAGYVTVTLSRTITVPQTAQTLSFDLDFLTDEFNPADPTTSPPTPASIDGTENDYATVSLGGTTLLTVSRDDLINKNPDGSFASLKPGTRTDADEGGFYLSSRFQHEEFDVSGLAGQTLPLTFTVVNVGETPGQVVQGYDSGIALDNIQVNPVPAPEPSPLVVVSIGAAGLLGGATARRRFGRAA